MSGDGPPGLAARLLELGRELRQEGVAVGTSELLDAFAVLREIEWTAPGDFREALAATMAKSQQDRRVFELVFDRFFFRAVELAAVREGVRDGAHLTATGEQDGRADAQIDLDELRERILAALAAGDESALRDLARLAIAAFARQGEGSGLVGVDVQRIRRALALRGEPAPSGAPAGHDGSEWHGERSGASREALRRFEALLRRELERMQAQRTGVLAPARALSDLDRALPSGPLADLAAVHRVVAQLRRRLATQGSQARGRRRRAHVDMRRTLRSSLGSGGVPVVIEHRPQRPRRPELLVLCDVSTSVSAASVFFLSVLHALHDSFARMRSFVFIERISEVTDIFARERSFQAVNERIANDAGVADVTGYTDYGRVWSELLALIEDDLHPRATLLVLGDARTNGRDPRADLFARVAGRAGRTLWLNPEPRLYWNYGDSVMAAYEAHCEAFECATTAQLEECVKALTRPASESRR